MKNLLFPALLAGLAFAPALAQTTPDAAAQPRPVAAFHAIEVSSGVDLYLTSGEPAQVAVSATSPEDRDLIKTTVTDGVLRISFDHSKTKWDRHAPDKHLRAYVTAARLTGLAASSGAGVQVQGRYPADSLQIDLSSGASLRADFAATALSVRLGSGSDATLAGRTTRLVVRAGSGSTFNGKNLQAAHGQADASSGATVQLVAEQTLAATASSGGAVRYSGAAQVSTAASSGGSVSRR